MSAVWLLVVIGLAGGLLTLVGWTLDRLEDWRDHETDRRRP